MKVRSKSANTSAAALKAVTAVLLAAVLMGTGGLQGVTQAEATTVAQAKASRAAHVRRDSAKAAAKARAKKRAAAARKVASARKARARKKAAAARARKAASARKARARKKAAAARARKAAGRRKVVSRAASRGWRNARASWYGPGFYGHGMAGGGTLQQDSFILAHKTLPFGTMVEITCNGKTVIAPVRDRGPYVAGREFDLGPGVRKVLGVWGVFTIDYRVLGR